MLVVDAILRLSLKVSVFSSLPVTDNEVILEVVKGFDGALHRGYLYQRTEYFSMSSWVIYWNILSTPYSWLSVFVVSV